MSFLCILVAAGMEWREWMDVTPGRIIMCIWSNNNFHRNAIEHRKRHFFSFSTSTQNKMLTAQKAVDKKRKKN